MREINKDLDDKVANLDKLNRNQAEEVDKLRERLNKVHPTLHPV